MEAKSIIDDIYQQYISEFNIQTERILDNQPAHAKELLFLACVRDFVNYKIGFDLFASLLKKIWATNPERFDFLNQTKIEAMCYMGSELSWYLRNSPMVNIEWLQEILKYYQKNKGKVQTRNRTCYGNSHDSTVKKAD